MCST